MRRVGRETHPSSRICLLSMSRRSVLSNGLRPRSNLPQILMYTRQASCSILHIGITLNTYPRTRIKSSALRIALQGTVRNQLQALSIRSQRSLCFLSSRCRLELFPVLLLLFFYSSPGCDQQRCCTFIFQQFYALYRGEGKSRIFLTPSTTRSESIVDDPVWVVCTPL